MKNQNTLLNAETGFAKGLAPQALPMLDFYAEVGRRGDDDSDQIYCRVQMTAASCKGAAIYHTKSIAEAMVNRIYRK